MELVTTNQLVNNLVNTSYCVTIKYINTQLKKIWYTKYPRTIVKTKLKHNSTSLGNI